MRRREPGAFYARCNISVAKGCCAGASLAPQEAPIIALSHSLQDRQGAGPSTARPRAQSGKSRIVWLDVAKGLGIIFVVLGHALGGIIDMPGRAMPPLFREVFLGIYIFHMPVFFLLSGLLVRPRLARSRKGFLIDLVITVAYPYFLWSTIQYSAIYAAGSLVNRPVDLFWPAILNLPWATISQFWYLYVLFLMHIMALILVPRIGARNFFLIAVGAKLLIASMAQPYVPPATIRLLMVHGLFYAAGVWAGVEGVERVRQWLAARRWLVVPLVIGAIAAILMAAQLIIEAKAPGFYQLKSYEISVLGWRLPVLPVATIATLAFLSCAFLVSGRIAAMLAYLGRRTMTIFVLHVMFIAGTRIILGRLMPGFDPLLLLGVCSVTGLLAPLIVYAVVRRFTTSRALGLG